MLPPQKKRPTKGWFLGRGVGIGGVMHVRLTVLSYPGIIVVPAPTTVTTIWEIHTFRLFEHPKLVIWLIDWITPVLLTLSHKAAAPTKCRLSVRRFADFLRQDFRSSSPFSPQELEPQLAIIEELTKLEIDDSKWAMKEGPLVVFGGCMRLYYYSYVSGLYGIIDDYSKPLKWCCCHDLRYATARRKHVLFENDVHSTCL